MESAQIQLTVPAPDSYENPSVETHPAELGEWIAQLPLANPVKMAEEIVESLSRLNRYPGQLLKHMELMECYASPFRGLISSLDTKRLTAPQSIRHEKLRMLTQKIAVEMAYGYKRLINTLLQNGKRGPKAQNLALAIHNAMEALSLELMCQYSHYLPDSKNGWREIAQLYGLAEREGLAQQALDDGSSIGRLFKTILLIILIDPYRLQRDAVWSCRRYLMQWADKAELLPPDAPVSGNGIFLVDLDGMQRPHPRNPENPPPEKNHRLLNAKPLNFMVHGQLQQPAETDGTSSQRLSADDLQMFRHMLLGWHLRPKRRNERKEKYGQRLATCGLSAINHFLRKGNLSAEAAPAQADSGEDGENVTLGENLSPTRNILYHAYPWRLFNMSAGGIGAFIGYPAPDELQIGQLVLIELENEQTGEAASLGIVRRMIRRDSDTLEVGIQFILGRPVPASFRRPADSGQQSCVAIERGHNLLPTLLAPAGAYRPRTSLILTTPAGESRIIADKLIEATPAFDRFEYTL